MKIKKIARKRNGLYEIILSDNNSLSFYDDTIIKYNLLKPQEISNELFEEIINYNNEIKAFNVSLKYITVKLRTKKEIEKKLKDYDKKIISKVIKKLENLGYLNDDLYIKSYIADQVNLKLNGPKKIIKDLEKLGFNSNDVRKVIDTYEIDIWLNKVKKIINKKINSNHKLSKNMFVNKLKQDLNYLGYDKNIIDIALNEIEIKDDLKILENEFNKEYKKLSRKYDGDILKLKIKAKLYQKGFSLTEIDKLINNNIE